MLILAVDQLQQHLSNQTAFWLRTFRSESH